MGVLRPKRPPTAEEARDALAAAEGALAEWAATAEQKTRLADAAAAELAELQARVGDQVLDAEDQGVVDALAEQVMRARTAQDVAHRAAEAARNRIGQARRDVLAARAVALRARASALRVAADRRQVETDRLLAALKAHEGVPFVVASGWRPETAVVRNVADSLVKSAQQAEKVLASGSVTDVDVALRRSSVPVGEVERTALDAVPVESADG